jgi:hypothetical protein
LVGQLMKKGIPTILTSNAFYSVSLSIDNPCLASFCL